MSCLAVRGGLTENLRHARGTIRAAKGDIRMLHLLPKTFVLGLLALALPLAAFANATVQSVTGSARAGTAPVTQNQRINSGTTITTASGAQVVLRFDDGQQVVLNQNTEFRIVDFKYDANNAKADRSVFDLVKGALRVVTGAVGRRNPAAFQLRAPQATIGIRGTDFMVAIVNPAYVSVLAGSVGVTNAAGTAVIGAGGFASVATAGTLAASIPASAIPAAASASFSTMGAAAGVGAGATGGAVAGGAATGAAGATGVTAGVAVGAAAVAVGVGAAAAAANSNDSSSTTPTTTHHP